MKAKSEGEDTVKYIDEASDKIREESTDLRDKIVKHADALLEDHLSELGQNVNMKQNKDRVGKFVDAVSDRLLLMSQYKQTLKDTEKTSPSILVHNYFKTMRQFKHVTRSSPSKLRMNLRSGVSEDLARFLKVKKFSDIKTDLHFVPLGGIDLKCASMQMICELNDTKGKVTGGCFLENGDIVLAHSGSSRLLQFNNLKLLHVRHMGWKPRDVVCQSPSLLLISKHNKSYTAGCVEEFDLETFGYIEDIYSETKCVFSLAISSGFVYAACSDFIVKFDSEGTIVKKYNTEGLARSVGINKSDEIISSSCSSHKVTIMDNSGEKLKSYFHEKLWYPYELLW